jgi:hypothetical protein
VSKGPLLATGVALACGFAGYLLGSMRAETGATTPPITRPPPTPASPPPLVLRHPAESRPAPTSPLVRDGPWREFHPNGRVASEGDYAEGKKQGTWTVYDEDGRAVRREEWDLGALAAPMVLFDPGGEFPRDADALERARVGGKYGGTVMRIPSPDDRARYETGCG